MNKRILFVAMLCLGVTATGWALTNYVVTPGTPGVTPTANYTSWTTAATNIQDAIDVVGSGGVVFVTNGTYVLTNQIIVANNITVRSFNNGGTDRDGTILDGNFPNTTNRCVYLNHASAVLDGFTVTNGYAQTNSLTGHGGGIYNRGTVTNSVVTGCEARGFGGGVYVDAEATLTHSTISGNVATNKNDSYGGGVYLWWHKGLVSDCLITDNKSNWGAGVFIRGVNELLGSELKNSTIANNEAIVYVAGQGSAGIGMQFKGVVDNCIVVSNKTTKIVNTPYYAGVGLHNGGVLKNSLVMYNTGAGFGGGVGVGAAGSIVSNCVIRNNQANNGGGIHLSGTALIQDSIIVSNSSAAYCQGGTMRNCLVAYNDSGLWSHTAKGSVWENCTVVGHPDFGMRFSQSNTVVNCIVYNNNKGGANWSYDENTTASNSVWMNSCTMPELTGLTMTGNITNSPRFEAPPEGNYRLKHSSPCVNTGMNLAWMIAAVDLDGKPRLVDAVDMGAYELGPPPGTLICVR